MLVIKKSLTLKKYLLIAVLTIGAITVDRYQEPVDYSTNIQEARFLGIGKKETPGPCNDLGYRVVENKFTIFGIRVGKKWYTEEGC